ncbi:MAG TPA: PAS domain S-box protein [Prolixibacteraceae bacterium]|nr:PAS domain S-box protein [Prolixibacteraceae bacterium]
MKNSLNFHLFFQYLYFRSMNFICKLDVMLSFIYRLIKRDTVEQKLLLAFLPVIIVILLIDAYIDHDSWFEHQNLIIPFLIKFIAAIPFIILLIYWLSKILDHKLSETKIALQTSEERFRTIFEKNSSAMLILETDSTVSNCNDAYVKMTGYAQMEVIGKSWTRLIPDSELERISGYNRLRRNHSHDVPDNYEIRFNKKNGETGVGLMSVFFDKVINQIVASVTDITERKEMELSLRKSEEKYRKLIEIQGEGFGVVDAEEQFIFTNPAADRIMGVPIGSLAGRNLKEFVSEKTFGLLREQTAVRAQGTQSTYEMEIVRADGEKRVLLVTATPTFNKKGEFESTLGIFIDITDRKKIENELKRNESELKALNTTKDKIFSIIAHDLRGPIGTSTDLLEAMIENHDDFSKEEQLKMLEILHNSAKSTFNLLETLLNWAVIQTGNMVFKPALFNLTKCIDSVVNNLLPTAQSKKITIVYKSAEDIFTYADQNMIQTVFRNLIGNAIKYTYNGGKIEVKTVNHGNRTEISISDNGMGMDEETSKNLFINSKNNSRYGTENEKGTGLGLILCKEFIEKHGGHIRAESEPGKGSSFIFDIPKVLNHNENLIQNNLEENQEHQKFDHELILIVEDEDINYQVLCSILNGVNLKYERATTGHEAVNMFLHNKYSLILMDVQLPEMNGLEATMKIRENNSEIPIVAVTAYTSDPNRKKSLDAGCNDFVTKPVNKAKLIQIIAKHLRNTKSVQYMLNETMNGV